MNRSSIFPGLFLIFLCFAQFMSNENGKKSPTKGKKKDLVDYTDAEIERLYEQWEVVKLEIYINRKI